MDKKNRAEQVCTFFKSSVMEGERVWKRRRKKRVVIRSPLIRFLSSSLLSVLLVHTSFFVVRKNHNSSGLLSQLNSGGRGEGRGGWLDL